MEFQENETIERVNEDSAITSVVPKTEGHIDDCDTISECHEGHHSSLTLLPEENDLAQGIEWLLNEVISNKDNIDLKTKVEEIRKGLHDVEKRAEFKKRCRDLLTEVFVPKVNVQRSTTKSLRM